METSLAQLPNSSKVTRIGSFFTTFLLDPLRGASRRAVGRAGLILAVLVLGWAPAVEATTAPVTWTQLNPATSPAGREDAVMAGDPATKQLVFFGGGNEGVFLNDTWSWTGTTWTQLSPVTSPSARAGGVLAYDNATSQLITFGGRTTTGSLGDTWSWTGTTWTQLSPVTSPSARNGYMMAYDPATRQLVLFGGGAGPNSSQSDTWVWTGTTWTQLSPTTSPSGRTCSMMAYDPATKQLLLFGGDSATSVNRQLLNDTWVWTGTTWTQLSPATSPSARFGGVMAYDPATSQLVLFGGGASFTGTLKLNDTWAWTGTTWSKLSPTTSPSARSDAKFAYDAATSQLLLFTGDRCAEGSRHGGAGPGVATAIRCDRRDRYTLGTLSCDVSLYAFLVASDTTFHTLMPVAEKSVQRRAVVVLACIGRQRLQAGDCVA
jgi:hypothetical protein